MNVLRFLYRKGKGVFERVFADVCALAFRMEVVAYDPYLPEYVFDQEATKGVSVEELLKVSDFVSIHMPLTPETKNLSNAKSIAGMKDDAVVLNMARGGIVN